ncbi:MAG: hypothetical protein MUD05_01330 [Candidatus Nanopelagicales bacterium]|nr:hypothetical protein [Candidatus Nanopelagicales bacterium]
MELSRRHLLVAGAGLVTAACAPDQQPTAGVAPAQVSPTPKATTAATPTSRWRAGKIAPAALLSAYANDSVGIGAPLQLHVSAASPWRASVYRIGYFAGKGATKVAEVSGPKRQFAGIEVDSRTRAVSVDWPVAAEIDTTGWASGLYTVVVRSNDGGTNIPFVVRADTAAGKVAIIAASMTWQAYNVWGGASLYRNIGGDFAGRSYAVSYSRPYDHSLWGAPIAMGFDVPVARFADEVGIDHVWFTNADIARDPGLLDGASGVVSTGHDEYWPQSYRRALIAARDAGSSLAFLGANAGYWRVGLRGDEVYCAKDAGIQPKNIRWRDLGKPESAVVGVLYDAFPVSGPMVIREPGFALFDGIKVSRGTSFPGLIGIESDRYYPGQQTPSQIEVPTLSPVTCRGKGTWSTMAYYGVPSGAKVFATGTMNWTRSLTGPSAKKGITGASSDFSRAVTANLLEGMADGSLPDARRDVPKLPDYNTSGAA